MAVRVSKIYGGAPVVNTFEIDDNFRERSDIQENIFMQYSFHTEQSIMLLRKVAD